MTLSLPRRQQFVDLASGFLTDFFDRWLVDLVNETNRGFNVNASVEYTIASGAITPQTASFTVDTESDAASDNLDTINIAHFRNGDVIALAPANDARTIVVTHNVGNIRTVSGSSITLDTTDKWIFLRYNGTNWIAGQAA